jgi:hypothetical protein
VAHEVEFDVLTDDERVRLLVAAAAEEREGRMVRCSTPDEVRALMASLSSAGS